MSAPGDAYGYRNKVELTVDRTSGLALGYLGRASDTVVPVDACLLLPAPHERAPRAIAGALRYLSGREDLGVDRVAFRTARHTGDVEVDLWATPGPFPRGPAGRSLCDAVGADTVTRVVHRPDVKSRAVRGVEVLAGKGHWTERLAGRTYAVSAPSFFQVNTAAAETLVSLVLASVGDDPGPTLDAYAGVGTFSLPLAGRTDELLCVESYGPAIRDLRRNLERHHVDAEVVAGDLARVLDPTGRVRTAVVDPPRAGMQADALQKLADIGVERLVYVSCDPATFARDASRLQGLGYRLARVTPVDLFPQTCHVELVAVLERGTR